MEASFNKLKQLMDTNRHTTVLLEIYDLCSNTSIDSDVADHFHPSVSINQFWWARSKVLLNNYETLRKIVNNIY
jgi:hypothetical protein